jgi:serine phosphatase RsbU (regulator of sigma subunit)
VEALAQLRGVFDQLPIAVCLLRGPRHLFEFTSPGYRALVGERALDGIAVDEAMPEMRDQGFIDVLDAVYRTGEQFVGREAAVVLLSDDGIEHVVVDFTCQPVRDQDGSVEGILVHAVDVTDGVRARAQLRDTLRSEHEDRFRRAIDSMLDTVMIAVPVRGDDGLIVDFVVVFVNAVGGRIDKRAREDLVGRRFTELWPNVIGSGLMARHIEVMETGVPLALDDFSYDDQLEDQELDGVYDLRVTRLDGELFVVVRNATERFLRERALAESRSRLAREHEAVVTLQAAILPRELPPVWGTDVAADYVAAAGNLEVGGDWFDVFVLPDGVVAVAIGDVAGKGIQAAQIMAQLRAAGRVAALGGQDSAGVLSCQNALMLAADLGPFATAVFALYHPATGLLSWASAGHLPPLLLSGGAATLLEGPARVPLGFIPEPGYLAIETTLAPGDRLVLYTDGLVERRGESIVAGLDRLVSVAPHEGAAETACHQLLAVLGVVDGSGDDVCVLTLDRLPT